MTKIGFRCKPGKIGIAEADVPINNIEDIENLRKDLLEEEKGANPALICLEDRKE